MSTLKTIYKNMLFLSGAEFISKILQFVLMIYAAKLLDPANFGKFSFALALSSIGIIAADAGINMLMIREVARNKKAADKYFINAFVLKVVFALFAYLVIILVLNVLNYPKDTRYIVYLVWIFTIISSLTDVFYSIFRAFEKMFYDALIKILRMVILTAIGLYVLFRFHDVFIFSAVFIFVEALMILLALFIALKIFIKIRLDLSLQFMKGLLKKSLPFGLAFVFSSVYFYISIVLLSKIKGDVDVAIFSVAYNLAFAILFIPLVYTNAIYPVMSRYYKTSKGKLIFIYQKSFKYLYMIGLPISFGTFFLADRIIVFFYGREYISSIIVLQIISWYVFIKFLNVLMGSVLSSTDEQNKRMASQGFTAIFNFVLSFILIQQKSYVGAAISMVVTEVFLFVFYYSYVSKSLYWYNFVPVLAKPLIASIIMAVLIKYVQLSLLFTIILSGIVYIVAVWALKTFEEDDMSIINKILKKADEKDAIFYKNE